MVAMWVQEFGGVPTADTHYSEYSMCIYAKISVAVIEQCMDEDSNWTMNEPSIQRFVGLQCCEFYNRTGCY